MMLSLKPSKSTTSQFLKYWIGGGVYFWSGFAIFAILYSGLDWDWLPAKIIADIVGWSLSYIVQRYWAFASDRLRLSEREHVGRYTLIEVISFGLDYLIIFSLKSAGVTPYIGFFISSAFFTVWSYFWYRYWVFPTTKNGS